MSEEQEEMETLSMFQLNTSLFFKSMASTTSKHDRRSLQLRRWEVDGDAIEIGRRFNRMQTAMVKNIGGEDALSVSQHVRK